MAVERRIAPGGTEVADGIHRLGDDYVNWYHIEDGGRLTGAGVLLPGHGEPWRSGVADAVRLARQR